MREVLARRAAGFGTTIFTEMSALAVQHGAVNLGQGFPDFPAPDFIKLAAAEAVAADHNQYPPMPGLPRLRQAAAAQWQRDTGRAVDWQNEVTVTSGATEALFDLALALLDPGDTALVIEPAYDSYVPGITMAGATPVVVRLRPPLQNRESRTENLSTSSEGTAGGSTAPTTGSQFSVLGSASGWTLDPGELRAAFARRPKLVLVNTPHNPTGAVLGPAELGLIAALCQEYDVLAICDEVYDRLVFDGARHLSLATLPGMWERTLTLNSIGKTFSVTGWKVGWAVGPAHLNHALRMAHQWVTFTTATPLQDAAAAALEHAATSDYYTTLRAEYDERRRLLHDILTSAGLTPLPAQGSFFVNVDIGALGYQDDRAFCRWLTTEIGVAAIPTSVFYSDPADAPRFARFCFAKKLETLHAAGERLQRLKDKG
jgi:aspartate/methionine/tyrosine aminotransferase